MHIEEHQKVVDIHLNYKKHLISFALAEAQVKMVWQDSFVEEAKHAFFDMAYCMSQ